MKQLSIKWKFALVASAPTLTLIALVSFTQPAFLRRDITGLVSTQRFELATRVAHVLDVDLKFRLNAITHSRAHHLKALIKASNWVRIDLSCGVIGGILRSIPSN